MAFKRAGGHFRRREPHDQGIENMANYEASGMVTQLAANALSGSNH
jgi:hypothetical protein